MNYILLERLIKNGHSKQIFFMKIQHCNEKLISIYFGPFNN